MTRRQQRRGAHGTTQAAADGALNAMRSAFSEALHRLIADTRETPTAIFADQAVAQLADAWAESAMSMIATASAASAPRAPISPAATADDLHASMLASLALIVEAARAGRPDLDAFCRHFADTFSSSLRDAIAGAYLRTAAAFEEQLGVSPGIAN